MAKKYKILNKQPVIAPKAGNDSNLLIVFYVQIMPDDFVMQLHRF
ncbi:putative phosphatidate cytidylyltransferase [Escherichia coli]|nr:putative phosphatidate cytidylyltransferase [Escherichia coli]SQS26152.1 putative phosphatidate cytidylyltransferase [Escherichia coli]